MGTEIQNKTLFSTSYSTRDANDNIGNNLWALYGKNMDFKSNNYQNPFLKRPTIEGYSMYEKEQLKQTILKHELIFKNQLEELHRLYKRQRDLMNEIKRRELYSPSELFSPDLSFRRPPPSMTYTNKIESPLNFTKIDILSSPPISLEKVPKRDIFQEKLNLEPPSSVSTKILSNSSYNNFAANLCSSKDNDIFDLNEPVQLEENHISGLNNNKEAGESIFGVRIGRLDEPSNKSDSKTRETKTIFGVEILEEIDNENEIGEIPTNNSKKIFGFSIVVPKSSPSNHNSVINDNNGCDSIPNSKNTDLVTEKGLNNYISNLKLQIDLNLSISDDQGPPIPSLPEAIVKIVTNEIDLESPSDIRFSENITRIESKLPLEESKEKNEELDKAAAEAIVAISSSFDFMKNTNNSDPISNFCDESLYWFANLATSYDDKDCDDYFEFMTLNLKETNPEEYNENSPMSFNFQKNEEKIIPDFSTRPRRGQGKRGKQKKDFQRDVLPGILSLSRHEVAEDMHSFEELFKTCGFVWKYKISKRSNIKSGRGRTNTKVTPVGETHLEKFSTSGVAGWGKRMRRLPRRRLSNG